MTRMAARLNDHVLLIAAVVTQMEGVSEDTSLIINHSDICSGYHLISSMDP